MKKEDLTVYNPPLKIGLEVKAAAVKIQKTTINITSNTFSPLSTKRLSDFKKIENIDELQFEDDCNSQVDGMSTRRTNKALP